MRALFFTVPLIFGLLLSGPAHAGDPADCRHVPLALKALASVKDPDHRVAAGVCLVRYQLDEPEVAKAVLRILRDPSEDILLREDLIDAFAESPLRKTVRIEAPRAAPKLGRQEEEALERTMGGAQGLVAVTQAMGSMEEVAPVTAYEGEFFRVLNDIARDEGSHVLLRERAVNALAKIATKVVESGVYEEKTIRLTRETLRDVSSREDEASYFTRAGAAYTWLVSAGVPGFSRAEAPTARLISSVKPKISGETEPSHEPEPAQETAAPQGHE